VGCNFTPSHAASPLEPWHDETFDLAAPERELDLAAGPGFTSLRVFLRDLLWRHDREGFLARLDNPWFHEILRPDGSPYDPTEVAFIRRVTGAA